MKRLNKILIAGTLCFSLGYIAHDIVGEAGLEFAGNAQANHGEREAKICNATANAQWTWINSISGGGRLHVRVG